MRWLLPAGTWLGEAAARSGRRTLVVFGAHFTVKLALHRAGLLGDLDTWRWGVTAWVGVVVVCAASALPAGATEVTA